MPRLSVMVAAAAAAWLVATLHAAPPKPSPTQIAWELEFEHAVPKRIEVQLAGDDEPTTFWYLLYTVTNPSPRSQRFFPIFQLVTDELKVIDTDKGVSPLVFDAIKQRHRRTHPYLVHPTEAIGELRTGDDHARESVAIWRYDESDATRFDIFISGLSGETRLAPNPDHNPDQPVTTDVVERDGLPQRVTVNPDKFVLRKTLQLRYRLPGSGEARRGVEPVFVSQRWVMR